MNRFCNFICKRKWVVISIYLVLLVLGIIGSNFVKINYNISDYLSDDSSSKVAIEVIEDEFGITGNLQVMVKDIDENNAKLLYNDIENIENVLMVNFNINSEESYKDNNALYIVLIDGSDYSQTALEVTEEVKDLVNTKYNYNAVYGGSTIEKQNLKNGISNEIIYIMIVAISLVIVILLFTSKSWVEPLILLCVLGVAIVINSGSNVVFGEISYITNSIAAILQLALSIDYSIVLIHTYKKSQEEGIENNEAMKNAIKKCVNPVSASGLTTIAGLLSLVFMSFTIGFDIGMVLMKGILISVITSLTLLPAVILLCDKLLIKTKKKALHLKGNFMAKIAIKASKFIVPIALIVIVLCAVLKENVNYSFSDTKMNNNEIVETFGQNNSVIVVFKNDDTSYQKQEEYIVKLNEYEENILVNYQAYINTVGEKLSIDKAMNMLELSEAEALEIYELYYINNDNNIVKLDFNSLINYTCYLILNDAEVSEMLDEETKNSIIGVKSIIDLLNSNNSSTEFYNALQGFGSNTSIDDIKHLYGIYSYPYLENNKVEIENMLNLIINYASSNEGLIDSDSLNSLKSLNENIKEFNNQMETLLTKEMFKYIMLENQVSLSDEEIDNIYESYFLTNNLEVSEAIAYLKIMNHIKNMGIITDEAFVSQIDNYNNLYNLINSSCSYNEFITSLEYIVYGFSGNMVDIDISDDMIFEMYIIYFNMLNMFDDVKILGIDFLNFILEEYETNTIIRTKISDSDYLNLCNMKNIYTLSTDLTIYNYKDMTNILTTLNSSLESDMISGIYIKYAISNNLNNSDEIIAIDLFNFINEEVETNTLLKQKLDSSKLEMLDSTRNTIDKALNIFVSDNYQRMILSLNVNNDDENSDEVVEYITKITKEVFGDDSYLAGELLSTYDLRESFEFDSLLISILTVVSIFIVLLVVFRSLSFPIVLLVVIQGAIWITCSILVLFKSDIFFMSYIVSSSILMGATIDYGILMANSYVEYRNELDKKEALLKAIETALPTIFTSGLILIICGFVISFISNQVSIATVGKIIGSGTITSVIMVLFVLPSILYLLDKFIIKLTLRKKKNN
ncbi:MAG: efflux RND transporter permease subunit [Anaeroplasmataceae bacterium]